MPARVGIIGCGLLGSAVARALAVAGADVYAWNRTSARAKDLEPSGVTPVDALESLVGVADLLVVAVTTYPDVEAVLAPVKDFDHRTVIVLSTGVPDDAARLSESLTARRAAYMDAAVLGYPADLGKPDSVLMVAGARDVWNSHEPTLRALAGGARHVSEDVTAANVIDVAATGAFYTVAYGAFVEAATYAGARGLDAHELIPAAQAWIRILRRNLEEVATAVATGQHETDQATVDVYLEAASAWREELVRAGLRGSLITAEEENLAIASAAGLGELGFSAQSQAMQPDSTTVAASGSDAHTIR